MKEEASKAADAVRSKSSGVRVRKPLFTCIEPEGIPEVPAFDEAPPLGDHWDKPWVIKSSDACKLCMAEPAVLNAMQAWGAQYHKHLERQKQDMVTHPLPEKGGRIPVNKLFMDLVPETQQLDLSSVGGGPEFSQAAWLFGVSRKLATISAAPNQACLFRALACGEIRMLFIETSKARDFLVKSGRAAEEHDLKQTLATLEDFTGADLAALKSHGAAMYSFILQQGVVLYQPPNFLVMEVARVAADATGSAATLIHGCRKSIFMKRFAKDYEQGLKWTGHTGSDRMQQILQLMKA